MNLHVARIAGLVVGMVCTSASAEPVSCMVLGSRDAVIKAVEGIRSPVFATKDCAALRLVSGNAKASWVGQDGKPRLLPITQEGVPEVPRVGAEERSVNVVWNELTTRRDRQQPAYMRSAAFDRPAFVYQPGDGLLLLPQSDTDAEVSVTWLPEGRREQVFSQRVLAGAAVRLPASLLLPDQVYEIAIRRGDAVESWRWKVVAVPLARTIDAQLAAITQATADADERLLLQAMLFDQLKIRSNSDLIVQQLRTSDRNRLLLRD